MVVASSVRIEHHLPDAEQEPVPHSSGQPGNMGSLWPISVPWFAGYGRSPPPPRGRVTLLWSFPYSVNQSSTIGEGIAESVTPGSSQFSTM
jgi:hypothetical protein